MEASPRELMARSLRIEYPGGLYHITSRGNKKENIFHSAEDKEMFLDLISCVCERFKWDVYSYCLMDNHYHLLVETPLPNLSKGMHYLNGVYTQKFNRVHSRVGHVFQGRYHSVIIDKDSYLLELSRYIVLNPVRAQLVPAPGNWKWSSYLSTCGRTPAQKWLKIDKILLNFGSPLANSIPRYKQFVSEGLVKDSPWKNLKHQIYLGEDAFVNKMMDTINLAQNLTNLPKCQYLHAPEPQSLDDFCELFPNRNLAIGKAYESGLYSLREIGLYFNLHYSRVSKIINMEKGKP